MNKHQITELALKILALGCFTYALSHAGYSLSFLFIPEAQFTSAHQLVAFFAPIMGPVLVGVLLILFAKGLSKRLLSHNEDGKGIVINIDPKELHSVLLSIFGFVLITFMIFPLFNLFAAYMNQGTDSKGVTVTISSHGFLFGFAFQLLLGFWFAFGAKGISGFVYKLRYAAR